MLQLGLRLIFHVSPTSIYTPSLCPPRGPVGGEAPAEGPRGGGGGGDRLGSGDIRQAIQSPDRLYKAPGY